MSETISIINPVSRNLWPITAGSVSWCAMLVRRGVCLNPQYQTIRDLMLAGF